MQGVDEAHHKEHEWNTKGNEKQIPRCARDDKDRKAVNCLLLTAYCSLYFSRSTTNSGAHSRTRLISESGKMQMALRAESA